PEHRRVTAADQLDQRGARGLTPDAIVALGDHSDFQCGGFECPSQLGRRLRVAEPGWIEDGETERAEPALDAPARPIEEALPIAFTVEERALHDHAHAVEIDERRAARPSGHLAIWPGGGARPPPKP